MRWFSLSALAAFLLLGACDSRQPPTPSPDAAEREDDRIECRIGGARTFERFCTLERQAGDILLIRKPDGGFRRLRLTGDGRGVEAADGAEPAVVTILDQERIAVDLGGDSFRFPARISR